jgi:hypothetical protein
MKLLHFAALALLGPLAACGDGGAGAGGVTAEESRQLNEAAAMLDAAPDTVVAADETGLGNGEAAIGNAETGALPVAGEAATNGQ